MIKIFKQLGRHWAACIAVVALLFVQACAQAAGRSGSRRRVAACGVLLEVFAMLCVQCAPCALQAGPELRDSSCVRRRSSAKPSRMPDR